MERSIEAWEEVQRHGLDLADRLAQGFCGLLHPPFPWPPSPPQNPFDLDLQVAAAFAGAAGTAVSGSRKDFPSAAAAVAADIGGRLGQAGAELGACVGGVVQHFFRQLPPPFRAEEHLGRSPALAVEARRWDPAAGEAELGLAVERLGDRGPLDATAAAAVAAGSGADEDEEGYGHEIGAFGNFKRARGTLNIMATYDSRNQDTEASLVARGDLWRVEASRGGSTSGIDSAPLFLLQLGPLLFVRDSTLLLPVHLSKQHLLWYGYDRKNGVHSICPAFWSKHRRWLLMSMMCLNPLACSFMDLQFPNGQLTYVAGEGLTASGFLPIFGGLLQAQGKCPGETRVSFSCKNKGGTQFTPMMHWPDKSFSFGVAQAIAWKRSGLMVRPSIQVSVCPTFGGSDPGIRAELIHSLKEELNIMCGFSFSRHPSAFTSLSLGRSKLNGHMGSSGVVITMETPLANVGRPSLSVQLNGGFEF